VRILVVLSLTACCAGSVLAAPNSTIVEPSVYTKHSCLQLFGEARALSARAAALTGIRQVDPTTDGSATKSAVVPWPKAFSVVSGNADVLDKLTVMRAHMRAIEEGSIRAQCSIQFPKPTV
jgi:hypothetical protein